MNAQEPALSTDTDGDDVAASYETVVEATPVPGKTLPGNRANTLVSRDQLELRLPRNAPDALRYEPGVYIQQTAHSQGSAYIRGLTGQQTLLLFDGIRLNNSTYRQGPNQYFFTLDSETIQSIEVQRGGGSTRYGSDALGGVILSLPVNADFALGQSGFHWRPETSIKATSADRSFGGRFALSSTLSNRLAFYGGVGWRRAGQLRSGGPITGVESDEAPLVARFAKDGVTQLGTGFKELTADGALRINIDRKKELKLAAYLYRQFDAPRTDQCPAAYAPSGECLIYDEQFRHLVYADLNVRTRLGIARDIRLTTSWQQQHERTTLNRPQAYVTNTGRDDVDTIGVVARTTSVRFKPVSKISLSVDSGLDTYLDRVRSKAWISFTDTGYTQALTRGKYLNGAQYLYGGAFVELSMAVGRYVTVRVGGRQSWIGAKAAGDNESDSAGLNRYWFPFVWNGGVKVGPRPFHLLANLDRSFRAPNLDDLTGRQQTGPGFQFENAALGPETATTIELGMETEGRVQAQLFGFVTRLERQIVRSPRSVSDCPVGSSACAASWDRFQLVNAAGTSLLRGIEGVVMVKVSPQLHVRTTVSYTKGDGPNPTAGNSGSDQVPLSRVPPLNGTVEVMWKHPLGITLGSGLRWAAAQTRLALSDISDERIPKGGTPGFAVLDIRASYRPHRDLLASLVLENMFNAAYRYHGSSVNGPGRGVMLLLSWGPLWRH